MGQGKQRQSRKGNREKLMKAALRLLAEDQSGLSGLSLRAVTKASALSPPAFYSHFDSMEALGLALVEEVGATVREVLRAVRQEAIALSSQDQVIEESIAAAFAYIRSHEEIFILVSRERAGSSARIRSAIRREVRQIVEDMAIDFEPLEQFSHFSFVELRALVGAIIGLGLSLVPDFLDLVRESPRAADELLKEYEFQVRLMARWPV